MSTVTLVLHIRTIIMTDVNIFFLFAKCFPAAPAAQVIELALSRQNVVGACVIPSFCNYYHNEEITVPISDKVTNSGACDLTVTLVYV